MPPEYLDVDEETLRVTIWGKYGIIPQGLNMLRLGFWKEYDRVLNSSTAEFSTERVYAGVCGPGYFYKIMKEHKMVAWILCRPSSYKELLEEGLSYSLLELRKILELPTLDKNGKVNKTILENKIKIFALLDARKHGAFVQRMEQKNLNISADAKDVRQALDQLSAEEIDRKIAMLEKKDGKKSLPDILLESSDEDVGPEAS